MVEGRVILPEEVDEEKLPEIVEEDSKESVEETPDEVEEVEQPKQGDIVKSPKEIDYGVIDEDGATILCKSFAEARILSLLLEIKGGK